MNSGAGGCYRNSLGEGREKKQRLIQVEGREMFDIRGFWMETGTFHRHCWSSAKGRGLSYFPARCAQTVVSAQPLATCKGRHLTEGVVTPPEGERVSEASSQHSARRNLHACVTECVFAISPDPPQTSSENALCWRPTQEWRTQSLRPWCHHQDVEDKAAMRSGSVESTNPC